MMKYGMFAAFLIFTLSMFGLSAVAGTYDE